MAEAVAALYVVETAIEGAAVGAYAASRPTVPLHVTFRKLETLNEALSSGEWHSTIGHTLNVVKGRGYIFGGDTVDAKPDSNIGIITLPQSLDSKETDFQTIQPEASHDRPLEPYATPAQPAALGTPDEKLMAKNSPAKNQIPEPRSEHCSTAIDSTIFFFAGRRAQETGSSGTSGKPDSLLLFDCSTIHCFSTQTSTWSTLQVDVSRSEDGIPQSRTRASCCSSSHPKPGSGIEVTIAAHGTIFLHGGYNQQGESLRDTWSFDVSSRTWTRWPDLPDPLPQEVAGEGRIVYQNGSLCHVGDGFGKVMLLDVDIVEGSVVTSSSGPHQGEVAIKPKESSWEVISFGDIKTDTAKSGSLPMPRKGAGFVSITTGAGRFYNLYFMGQDGPDSFLHDIWTLQVKSKENTAAALKDRVRQAVGKSTGENEWAMCEVVQSTKNDGPLKLPGALTGFAADTWTDLGGANVLVVGGQSSTGKLQNAAWIMSIE